MILLPTLTVQPAYSADNPNSQSYDLCIRFHDYQASTLSMLSTHPASAAGTLQKEPKSPR
jgi:hypothetical protein